MEEKPPSSYGSRWKKWLLIYVGVAVVAYLLIYLIFFSDYGS